MQRRELSNSKANNRIAWVDTAKGFGIILVVYGHVARGLYSSHILPDSALFQFLDASIYSFHMPLFFFLSGMFFLGSYKKYALTLFTHKIATIVYPYFLWSFIQLGIKLALSGYTNSPTSYKALLTILWLPVEQFWFLYALFLITSVHILFLSLTDRLHIPEKYSLWLILVTALLLYSMRYLLPGVFQIQTVCTYMIYFSLGLYFSNINQTHTKSRPLIGLPFCFLLLCYTVLYQDYWSAESSFLQLTLAVTGIGSVCTLSPFFARYSKFILSVLGKYSMEIFCTHIIAASGVRIVLLYLFHISNPLIHLVFGVSCGLLLPVLCINLLKKHSFSAYLFSFPRNSK
ncbi:MAG: acyltransferase [Desulfotalea sp.]